MTETIALFIGADNETGVLDMWRIENIVGKRHRNFTVIPAAGYWQGGREDSVMVIISGDRPLIEGTARMLKSELRQDAIGMQVMPEMQFI